MTAQSAVTPNSRILLVEDHEHIRKLVRASIKPLAVEVDEVFNTEDALRALSQEDHGYGVIILDVMLPGPMNGFELCHLIKKSDEFSGAPRPFVLMLTARAQVSDRQAAAESGADVFMTKPFSPLELLKVVRSQFSA